MGFRQWIDDNYGTCYRYAKSTGVKLTTAYLWYRKDKAPPQAYDGTYEGRPDYQPNLTEPQRILSLEQVNNFLRAYSNDKRKH